MQRIQAKCKKNSFNLSYLNLKRLRRRREKWLIWCQLPSWKVGEEKQKKERREGKWYGSQEKLRKETINRSRQTHSCSSCFLLFNTKHDLFLIYPSHLLISGLSEALVEVFGLVTVMNFHGSPHGLLTPSSMRGASFWKMLHLLSLGWRLQLLYACRLTLSLFSPTHNSSCPFLTIFPRNKSHF